MAHGFSGGNNVIGACLGAKVTIEGGVDITSGIEFPPFPTTMDVTVTNPTQFPTSLDVKVTNKVELAEGTFDDLLDAFNNLVVAFDSCACLGEVEGKLFVFGDGSMRFVGNDGVENNAPDLAQIKSACCKAKPIGFCQTCYNDVEGFMFAMSDYTFNFVPKDDPTNITMNISPLDFECKCGKEEDCFDANVFKWVHKQQHTSDVTFPAGAYRIILRNDDPNVGSRIFINGVEYLFNDAINLVEELNHTSKIQDFVPEIKVTNPDGLSFEYSAQYPSNTLANLNNL